MFGPVSGWVTAAVEHSLLQWQRDTITQDVFGHTCKTENHVVKKALESTMHLSIHLMPVTILASFSEHFHPLNALQLVAVHRLRTLLNIPVTHINWAIITVLSNPRQLEWLVHTFNNVIRD